MTKNVTHGSTRTTPSHATIFPVPPRSIERVASSIRHHEIPAATTASATAPDTTFAVTVLSSSMPGGILTNRAGQHAYKCARCFLPKPALRLAASRVAIGKHRWRFAVVYSVFVRYAKRAFAVEADLSSRI